MDVTDMKSFKSFLVALWLVCVILATLFFSFYVALSVDQDGIYISNSEQVADYSVVDGEIKHQNQNGIKSLNDVTSIVDEDDILFAYIKPSIAPATPLYIPVSPSVAVPMSSITPSSWLCSAHDASIIDDTVDKIIKEHKSYMQSGEMIEKVDQKDVFDKDAQSKEKINLIDNLNDDKLVFQSHSSAIEDDPNVNVLSKDEFLPNEVSQQFRSRKIMENSFNDNNLKKDDAVSWTLLAEKKFPEASNLQNDFEIFHNQNFDKKVKTHFSDDVIHSDGKMIHDDSDNLMDQNDLNDSKTPKTEFDKNSDLYNSKPVKKEMLSFAEWKKKLDTVKEEVVDGSVKSNNTKRKNLQMSSKRTIKKNYASIECGAKVIAANEEATNQIAILKEDKDTYMLNPCNVRAWFIVELCERIELDSIDLANFEMFSSSPESFNVYISSRYPTREWEKVGVFQGTPLKEIKTYTFDEKFYAKYMKIEIKKYFGSEHYCPLSLLRVFGITEVEQFDSEDHEDNDSLDDEFPYENKTRENETINIFASAKNVMVKLVNTVAEKISGTKFRNNTNLKNEEINKSDSENVLTSDYVVLLPDEVDHDTSIIVDSFEFMKSSNFRLSLNPKSRIWFDHSLLLKTCPLKNFLKSSFEKQFNYTMSKYNQPDKRCTKQKMEDSINSIHILQPSFQTPLKSDILELKNLHSFENSFISQLLTIEMSLANYTSSSREKLKLADVSKVADINEKELMSNQHSAIGYNASIITRAETPQVTESSLKFLESSFSRTLLKETPSLSSIDDLSVHTILTTNTSKFINSTPELTETRESVPNKMAVVFDEVGISSNQTDSGTFMKGDEISKLILTNQSVPLEVSVTYTSSSSNFESFAEINSNTLSSIILEETTNNTNGFSETTKTLPGLSGSKESIIMKLNAKVKALQANLTLSMMYLEEMSERYRNAVEEVDKRHNSKSLALNLSISSQKDISITQAKLLSNLSHEIFMLTDQLKSMAQSMEEQRKASEVQFSLIFVEFFLVIILVLVVCCKKTPVIINPSSKNDAFVQKNSKDVSQEELVAFSENRKRSFVQRGTELLQNHVVETVKKKRRKKNRPSLDDSDVDAKFSKTAGLLFSAGKGILSGITGAFCWRSFAYEKRSRFTEALLDTNLQRSDVRNQKKQLNRAKSLDLKTIHENESISQFSNRPRSVGAL